LIVAAEFVAQWAMIEFAGVIPIVGKIFRTTPLPFSMILTSVLLGAGSLLVSIILKATPEQWVDKIKIELNEDGQKEGSDFLSSVSSKIQGSFKRSETERLLDSQ